MSISDSLAVYIVDDDAAVRDALSLLLSVRGFRTACFASSERFLEALRPEWAGCLLVDIRMPGMNGIDLLAELQARDCHMPAVVITGHGDVAAARAAFHARAVDFLEKPVDDEQLVAALGAAFSRETARLEVRARDREVEQRLAELTPREREVMRLVATGSPAREIGEQLGISPRTVEVHRARLMDKLGVRRLPDLVRLAVELETNGRAPPG